MTFETLIARIRGALLLDPVAFEEARDDAAFTPLAAAAAGTAAVLGGVGALFWATVILDVSGDFFLEAVILGSIFLVAFWGVGLVASYILLTMVWKETVAPDALGRVVALGYVPFGLSVLVFIPGLGFAFALMSVAAMFHYTNFGVRSAFPEIAPLRAMLAVAAGFAVWIVLLAALTGPRNAFTPGPFVFEWTEDVVQRVTNFNPDEINLEDYIPTQEQ